MSKEGILYFSTDVNMCDDRKLKIIRGSLSPGCEQWKFEVTLTRILNLIYSEEGYYADWSDEDNKKIINEAYSLEVEWQNRVVDLCVEQGFFNAEIYEKYHVITSNRIFKNFMVVGKKRFKKRDEMTVMIADYIELTESAKPPLRSVVDHVVFKDHEGATVYLEPVKCEFSNRISGKKKEISGKDEDNSGYKSDSREDVSRDLEEYIAPQDLLTNPRDSMTAREQIVASGLPGVMMGWFMKIAGGPLAEQTKNFDACSNLVSWGNQTRLLIDPNGEFSVDDLMACMVEAFQDLKKADESKRGFWREMPMLPQRLWQQKDQVYERVKSMAEAGTMHTREEAYAALGG